ncbi:hypothetical protein [Streptomyces sp. GC420]|uniref:hypothetical protein n=1 Tax=Streptomyces sp. GC420 TaxID=2697568 RepID=UPI001414DAE7|nr:hypothetical protein [Streptomyces sp. GC420]NBM15716.1 hypothetical protein [Streptomyces sp. GC420]
MQAHAAHARAHQRAHVSAGWATPVTIGVVYGLYAWFLARNEQYTAGAAIVGVVSGAVMALCLYGLHTTRSRVMPELRGLAYGALAGIGIGYLYSLGGGSLLATSIMGLIVGLCVAVAAIYRFTTRPD